MNTTYPRQHIGDCCARPEDEVLPNSHGQRRECIRCGCWSFGMLVRTYHDVGCPQSGTFRRRGLYCYCI